MSQLTSSRPYTAWQLIRTYWQSEQRLFAYGMFIGVTLLTLFIMGIEVSLSYWYNYFYDALQEYDKVGTWDLIKVFIFLAAVFIIATVYRYYLEQFLALRWRRWLTNQFIERWLSHHCYYHLENFNGQTDNPDQRIQEDISALVSSSLELTIGFIGAAATLIGSIFILWKLSGDFTLSLGSLGTLHLPGYLVWVAIIYSIIGTYLTVKLGKPLVELNFTQQRLEANFRYAAVDLRSHAEHVALYRGEHHEQNILSRLFNRVLDNWYVIILRQKILLWFTAGYNQVSVIVPLAVVLPNYFGKVFKLGGLMQSIRAFGKVQEALSFFINAYTDIAHWQAVAQRLLSFLNYMNQLEQQENPFICQETPNPNISLKNIVIKNPQGKTLLENVDIEFIKGEHYLLQGPSGIGKSTLIRAIAGIWPYGSGSIELPNEAKIMYVPQKSYMPIGTLRQALEFPNTASEQEDRLLIQALMDCNLAHLTSRLDEAANWSEQLSPGEMQRIAFARILLQSPNWVFLDESTASLDLASEKLVYELIKSHAPHCSIISVAHRSSVAAFHTQTLDLTPYSLQ